MANFSFPKLPPFFSFIYTNGITQIIVRCSGEFHISLFNNIIQTSVMSIGKIRGYNTAYNVLDTANFSVILLFVMGEFYLFIVVLVFYYVFDMRGRKKKRFNAVVKRQPTTVSILSALLQGYVLWKKYITKHREFSSYHFKVRKIQIND